MTSNIMDNLDMPATVDDVLREVSRLRSTVTEAVDDGMKSAMRAMKKGRHAAEDALDDARHTVKQKPIQTLGIALAVGILIGCAITFLGRRD